MTIRRSLASAALALILAASAMALTQAHTTKPEFAQNIAGIAYPDSKLTAGL